MHKAKSDSLLGPGMAGAWWGLGTQELWGQISVGMCDRWHLGVGLETNRDSHGEEGLGCLVGPGLLPGLSGSAQGWREVGCGARADRFARRPVWCGVACSSVRGLIWLREVAKRLQRSKD